MRTPVTQQRWEELQPKGKGVLEADDRDKGDLPSVRSQPQKEGRTLE